MPAIDPTIVYPDDLEKSYDALAAGYDEPFDANFVLLKALYLAAQAQGLRILLDGGAGDIVLNEGSYIQRLIKRGQIGPALRAIRGQTKYWEGPPFLTSLSRYSRSALTPCSMKKLLQPLRRKHYVLRSLEESIISRELTSHVDIPERFARYWELQSSAQNPDPAVERCNKLLPNALAGRERYARIAASVSMEARDPFMDRRVVQYCARLPARLLMKNGWPKSILRDVMADRLPDEVISCTGKPHIGWIFYSRITKRALETGEVQLKALKEILTGYVEPDRLDKAWRDAIRSDDFEDLHTALALFKWLQENVKRPVAEIQNLD
jgi:asparagine synthase (glutamine-hydrolysing)